MTTNKNPSFKYEQLLWDRGYRSIAGIDEVGRGAFAGPIVAAAVVLPKEFNINGIKDSKLLTPKKREELSEYIIKNALDYVISEVDIAFINEFGIGKANNKIFIDCLNKIKFNFVLVDGPNKIKDINQNLQKEITHGDSISVSIAAASIVAKVYRDNLMIKLHESFPEYNFEKNKGYGTKEHRDAIKKYGFSKIHRTSFKLDLYL